jgi:hypothetical protein
MSNELIFTWHLPITFRDPHRPESKAFVDRLRRACIAKTAALDDHEMETVIRAFESIAVVLRRAKP